MRYLLAITTVVAALALGAPALASGQVSAHAQREGTNPTIAQKVLGWDRMTSVNGTAPDVLILGSSRAVMLDPRQVKRLTGLTAFNGGISSAVNDDLLALTSFTDLRGGGTLPRLVVMLDLEMFAARTPKERVVDYQSRIDAAYVGCSVVTACGGPWRAAAAAIAADAAQRDRDGRRHWTSQRVDGRQINGNFGRWERQGIDLRAIQRRRIQIRVNTYRQGRFRELYAHTKPPFERLLRLANERGVTPVVVITTMHPDCIRRCGPLGWSARRSELQAYLRTLAKTTPLRMIDLSYPATWGGGPRDFYDDVHLRPHGAAKVIDRLVRLRAFER